MAIFHFIYNLLSSIAPFFILLGFLVFIHELGHFLVARWCGVSVEVFSLGFGPKIFKYQKGETLYCISLIPLGGYVKMFGDNFLQTLPENEQKRGFLYQSIPKKLAIAFGGPLMNLLFTLLAFYLLASFGLPSLPPIVGDIAQTSSAYQKGFRAGDKIFAVGNKKISYWQEVAEVVKEKQRQPLDFEVISLNGSKKLISFVIDEVKNKNVFEWKQTVGEVEGLTPLSLGTQLGVTSLKSPAAQIGIKTFDLITHINDKEVRFFRDLKSFFSTNKKSAVFSLQRMEKNIEKTIHVKIEARHFKNSLKDFGLESLDLYVDKIGKGTPADEAGLQRGDKILSLNGKKIHAWQEVLDIVQAADKVNVTYLREDRVYNTLLQPKTMYVEGQLKERKMIGIASASFYVFPKPITKPYNLIQAAGYSVDQTLHWLSFISIGLVRLAQGRVSFRTMGGPVAIGRIAHKSFQSGFRSFFLMMAIISLSLFFFNLLPIPLLDGGHILFFSLEALFQKKLDPKKILISQQAGLLLLASFFVFVFCNDIFNWINAW